MGNGHGRYFFSPGIAAAVRTMPDLVIYHYFLLYLLNPDSCRQPSGDCEKAHAAVAVCGRQGTCRVQHIRLTMGGRPGGGCTQLCIAVVVCP